MFLIDPFRFGAAAPSFSVWDPATLGAGCSLSNTNHTATTIGGTNAGAAYGASGHANGSGDWYFEVTVAGPDAQHVVGLGTVSMISGGLYPGFNSNGFGYYGVNGQSQNSGGGAAYGATFTAGDVIGVRLKANGDVIFYKNGASQGVAFNLTTLGFGTNAMFPAWGPGTSAAGTRSGTINTGDSAFNSLPSGASAWG